jgi:hypothetical protein
VILTMLWASLSRDLKIGMAKIATKPKITTAATTTPAICAGISDLRRLRSQLSGSDEVARPRIWAASPRGALWRRGTWVPRSCLVITGPEAGAGLGVPLRVSRKDAVDGRHGAEGVTNEVGGNVTTVTYGLSVSRGIGRFSCHVRHAARTFRCITGPVQRHLASLQSDWQLRRATGALALLHQLGDGHA